MRKFFGFYGFAKLDLYEMAFRIVISKGIFRLILTTIIYFLTGCFGYEPNVQRCQWYRRKLGSGVCDHHPNLGKISLKIYIAKKILFNKSKF